MDKWEAMQVFVRVVESGSFVRAAQKLELSTTATSRLVAELESHLGTRLLQRSTRRLNLTETGFGLDTQVTAMMLLSGVRPFEVPVSYYSRSHEQGKKINWRDAVRCLWILVRTRAAGRKRIFSSAPAKSAELQRR